MDGKVLKDGINGRRMARCRANERQLKLSKNLLPAYLAHDNHLMA